MRNSEYGAVTLVAPQPVCSAVVLDLGQSVGLLLLFDKLTIMHHAIAGEVIFWVGSYMTGVGSLSSPLQWTAASVGLAGIIAIMAQATESLEKKQALR